MRSSGLCTECGNSIHPGFHADHRIPFSKGGQTLLANGQALCAGCNLSKGNTMKINLREWQQSARKKAVSHYLSSASRIFVIDAAPGAGKTKVACVIAHDLIHAGHIDRVIIIAPRSAVVDQWAKEFAHVTGRHMMKITSADSIGAITADICATWAAIRGLADTFQDICASARVLVICDEHHHAAIEAAWGASADSAFAEARHVLVLTGTPLRSDGAQSVWLGLDAFGGLAQPEESMFKLSYGEAVELGYCRPATFHRHRGAFTVDIGGGETVTVTGDNTPAIPASHPAPQVLKRVVDFYRLAQTPQFGADQKTPRKDGYQGTMIACASDKLDELRLEMPEAGGLVIAPSIEMADYFARLITLIEDTEPMIVHSGHPNAERRIETFRVSRHMRWLVAVGMVSEGVDIPRLRVLVYLPKALTELAFRQAVGRVVRNAGPNDRSRAYVVMPSFTTFEEYARRIEEDMPASSLVRGDGPRMKRCAHCGGENALGASRCVHCAGDFLSRQANFRACPACSRQNRVGAAECLHCGADMLPLHPITLLEAARDGVIARGIEIDEEEVRKAEEQAPAIRARLARSEDETLARIFSTIPVECYPAIGRLFAERGESEGQTEE
ncbi:DEAD/DEAH box helicase family protein [Altericroceibacterium xinjiangense]|uniref:DEAD/DEAH box helicase family protein n=1 Tax=Altericroceibacterium xinjiangense TaxID=762261 RepID=UPI00240820DA|nr:DEAD/DEAH box helicase family protein [Altericroceibacterium xinjiangense]